MATLTVKGGSSLFGRVSVSGSKNAALPILFSCLATKGVSRISRVPDITDVRVALEIIEGYGAFVLRSGDTLYIDTRNLIYREPPCALVSKIRASTYILGASLARFGKCRLSDFGGCNFAERPIDLHIAAAESFGALRAGDGLTVKRLSPTEIHFPKRSVGATANALILAASAEGESVIRGHAKEPHIIALADFLRSAGAKIRISDDKIEVVGCELHGGCAEIIGDMIEAGSYLAAALVTDGRVGVFGADVAEMATFISFLEAVGANIEIKDGYITAERGSSPKPTEITAEPYPAYPTDLQPIAAPILATHMGGEIFDKVFPERFGYLEELAVFGVKYKRGRGSAEIFPSKTAAASVTLPDLRGGMACLLTALCAQGESRLFCPELLLRGYERLDEKLLDLGADIKFE